MATKSESKKQIEAILGEKIDDDAVQLIQFFLSVALTTKQPGSTTQRHQIANLPNRCYENHVLDVSGIATSANNGQSVFRLTNFMCPAGEVFRVPVNRRHAFFVQAVLSDGHAYSDKQWGGRGNQGLCVEAKRHAGAGRDVQLALSR